MVVTQFKKAINAQASVLLVYCIFLFFIGLMQISLGILLRLVYMLQLDVYCYPDWCGCLTLVPFLIGILYYTFKGKCLTILLSITSLISFLGSIAFTGILLFETHLYDLIKIKLNENQSINSMISKSKLLQQTMVSDNVLHKVPNRSDLHERWFFIIVFLILGLSLLQIFLSMVGTILAFVWSPCCQSSYKKLRSRTIVETPQYNGRVVHRLDASDNGSTRLLKVKLYDDV